ncbi:hypothetical protein CsSME_00052096 [Camellia sinensis var. sinensis]
MASFTSTVTSSTWPRRMCACGHGPCIVKISRSAKNPGRLYFACPRPVVSHPFFTGHNCMNINNPLLIVPSFALICPVSVGLVSAKNQGERTKTMHHPETKLSCNYGLMS